MRVRMHGCGVPLHVLVHGSRGALHVIVHGRRNPLHVLLHGSGGALHVLVHGHRMPLHVVMHWTGATLQVRRQVLGLRLGLGRPVRVPHLMMAWHCMGTTEHVSTQPAIYGRSRMRALYLLVHFSTTQLQAVHIRALLHDQGLSVQGHACELH